jgi:hypothetical protein
MSATRKIKHPNGTELTVPTVIASGLVHGADGWEYVDGHSKADDAKPLPATPAGTVIGNEDLSNKVTTPSGNAEPQKGEVLDSEAEAPAGNASKDEWVEYAVSQGYDPAEVERLSRTDIRELFQTAE